MAKSSTTSCAPRSAEAVAREKLNPAGGPAHRAASRSDPGADLKYAAVFEVLPEVKLQPVDELDASSARLRRVADADRRRHDRDAAQAAPGVHRGRTRGRDERSRHGRFRQARSTARSSTAAAARTCRSSSARTQVMQGIRRRADRRCSAGERASSTLTFAADHANKKLAGKTAALQRHGQARSRSRRLPALDEEFAKGFRHRRWRPRSSADRSARQHGARTGRSDPPEGCARRCSEACTGDNPIELPRQLVEEQIQEMQMEMLRRAGVRDAEQAAAARTVRRAGAPPRGAGAAHERTGAQRRASR